MAAIVPSNRAMNSDDEMVPALCGLRKKPIKMKRQNQQKYKKETKEFLIEENVKLKEELQQLKHENQQLKDEAEGKNKQLIEVVANTVKKYNITDCDYVITGDGNTVIDGNRIDVIEHLRVYLEQICAELAESTKEQAQATFELDALKRIVQNTYNKVCSLSIDNTTIQNKLETIENMLDIGRSQTWDELQLEKAIHAIKDWLQTRSSDSRITYAMLPMEGKRLTERMAVMYGSCLHKFKAALEICNNVMYVGKTSQSEDVCAEVLVRWITDKDGNTSERLYVILTQLDHRLLEEQEKKILEKAAKRRSYHSLDGVSQKSSQASSGNLFFEENYF